MKYLFTCLPNSAHANRFEVRSPKKDKEAFFNIAKELIDLWGNPVEEKLREMMIAYIKRNGWAKEPVNIGSKNSLKNLNQFIASLNQEKAGK